MILIDKHIHYNRFPTERCILVFSQSEINEILSYDNQLTTKTSDVIEKAIASPWCDSMEFFFSGDLNGGFLQSAWISQYNEGVMDFSDTLVLDLH